MRTRLLMTVALAVATTASAQRRPVVIDDQFAVQDVGSPELSPDGEWVAYTLTTWDIAADKRNTDLWKVRYDGSARTQLTFSPENETAPKWSPDGRYLAFLSSRPGPAKGNQVWLLESTGGEARQLTGFKGGVTSFEWSPDSARLALVRRHGNEAAEEDRGDRGPNAAPPPPIVLDAYQFKRDGQTYITAKGTTRVSLFDVATRQEQLLTSDKNGNGPFDESSPSWSPDGTRIAFVSNHDEDWDRTRNNDVFVVDARPGSASRKLTTFPGQDGGAGFGDGVVWSPDGKWIAYGQGSEPKQNFHSLTRLAIVAADGSVAPRLLTADLDRGVNSFQFSADGAHLTFTVADDRTVYLARVPVRGGAVERLTSGARVVGQPTYARGRVVATVGTSTEPAELYAVDAGRLRKLTTHNDTWLATVQIQAAEDIAFTTPDGVVIHGLLTKPVGYVAGQKYPTLLRLHGGPTSQDAHTFNFERQIFAARGYAVVNVNYRGSSGRGETFQESIFGDWGNFEVVDVLAATDHVVSIGVADPNRLGIGGWSYGGVLTDYVIASDTRFKAAISGAGSANHISLYGHDQYTYLYDSEFGPPWKNLDAWVKFSYPFFKADRITTPTLFVGGQNDFNVPILGSEQLYQALKTLRVPTQLVVYPGQNHGLTRVPYLRDRLERYLAWYGKYLQPGGETSAPSAVTQSSRD
ncbi:MAG TPA: S9 family peptidase [Luteitalea sp.]|nr:S9 family peptidase [Luteitalea sp.]